MESFFEFIFANFFLVIIIVAAIINFLNRGRREENKQEPAPKQQRRRPTISDMRETYEQAKETIVETRQELEKKAQPIDQSVVDQRKEQYERLRSRYQPTLHTESKEQKKTMQLGMQSHSLHVEGEEVEYPEIKVNLDKKLTSRGLIESVIMAEVLGPPRALSPYQNIVSKRKRR